MTIDAALLLTIIPVTMLLTTVGRFAVFTVWASGFMVRKDGDTNE